MTRIFSRVEELSLLAVVAVASIPQEKIFRRP